VERELHHGEDLEPGCVEICAACRPWEVPSWREGHQIPLCARCRAWLALIGSVLDDDADVQLVIETVREVSTTGSKSGSKLGLPSST
jgi:hypothetical protein